jgi:putative tricarboxylic transport membrane protein
MDVLFNLAQGFLSAMSVNNLIACFAGVLLGTIAGVLPGIGPTGTMALLLPLSFGMDPGTGLIMLAGIYYGSMYGGSTTSILVNVPGEPTSMMTCIDGHKMAKKGRAGAALAAAAIGSWVAGTIGIVGLMLFAPPLAKAALAFGPPEFFSLGLAGLLLLSNLTGGSFAKSFLLVIIGMMMSTVGIDVMNGFDRFTFGVVDLANGFQFIPVVMGLFGLSEVFSVALNPYETAAAMKVKFKELYPTKTEMKRSVWPIFRGTILGFPLGLLPGPSAFLSTLISYKIEKQVSKYKDEIGTGAIEGVAGPESANNAASTGAMIPLLALGIPFAPPTALLLGGLMIHGITPGPLFITEHANIFWLVIASMYIGNVMLLLLNLPLVGVFASFTRVPVKILMPIVTVIMFVGAYSLNNSIFDLWIMLIFGIIGLFIKFIGLELSPLIIGLVLGSVFEEGLRQGLVMVEGHFLLFFERPISAVLLSISIAIVLWVIIKQLWRRPQVHPNTVNDPNLDRGP